MNYYLDTEFLEGSQKERFPISLFRKNSKPTIDLISIGIVAEDGREYYAISKDFNLKEAWNRFQVEKQTPYEKQNGFSGRKVYWIRENVLKPIYYKLTFGDSEKVTDEYFSYSTLEYLIKCFGKTNNHIAQEIIKFIYPDVLYNHSDCLINQIEDTKTESPKFYAYYADYDWVAFCWLFGKMMDLPNGFPMYCIDLKQTLDDKADWITKNDRVFIDNGYSKLEDAVKLLKSHYDFPKQENEHDALADARWNKKLHEFLKKAK
jgi:hypothetical protein